ncbi:MAG: NADH-quinone oxidoreductase subunit L [Planctomycetota bacterium]|nr:NADH-quinone oxidoreductase subunit L [Planctomycetota bacterium]
MVDWLVVLIPGLPLVAAIVTAILGPRFLRSQSHLPVIGALALSLLCSLVLVVLVQRGQTESSEAGFEIPVQLWSWAVIEDAHTLDFSVVSEDRNRLDDPLPRPFRVDVTLRADALTATMLAMVTFISTLVAVFSVGYMHDDRGYWRFFTYLGLFVFSMAMLVSVSNFLLLFVFWEGVGVCSYLLIGFWYTKPSAAAAGKKAFLVNRVGDFGLIIAVFLIWTTYGTVNYHDVLHTPADTVEVDSKTVQEAMSKKAEGADPGGRLIRGVLGQSRIKTKDFVIGPDGELVVLAICLLFLLGACGKSAQFPLHIWLPDAMEGPTPVSALIHAATMVTAGVYLVVRCTPLFAACPTAQLIVACVGGFTALLAAVIALTQFDLKRVLAYSTISQLGYMFLALGTGTMAGITAGFFHLFTHAFFKALLFLGAGSVMHAMGNVIDMRKFGGLRHILPKTHLAFLCGCLALAGIPPLSGFWSKDQIVKAVKEKADQLESSAVTSADVDAVVPAPVEKQVFTILTTWSALIYRWLHWSAMFTALLTAFYTFRAYYLTFWGRQYVPEEADHPHEAPASMWGPLAVLSVCALAIGGVLEPFHQPAGYLQQTPSLSGESFIPELDWGVAFISSVIALAGVGIASVLYLGDRRVVGRLQAFFELRWLPRVTRMAVHCSPYRLSSEKLYLDELYGCAVIWPLRTLANISGIVDRWLIDGLVNLIGWLPRFAGWMVRSLHKGLLQFYALGMVLGLLLLVLWMWWIR